MGGGGGYPANVITCPGLGRLGVSCPSRRPHPPALKYIHCAQTRQRRQEPGGHGAGSQASTRVSPGLSLGTSETETVVCTLPLGRLLGSRGPTRPLLYKGKTSLLCCLVTWESL